MKVTLPKKEKLNIKAIIIYTVSIIACIVAIIVIGLSAYFGSEELDRLITVGGSNITQEDIDYQLLLANFDNIFQNQLEQYNTDVNVKKIDDGQEIVYTYYSKDESKENSYDLKLNIPYINIDNETIAKYNQEIKETYEGKAESTLKSENQNIIYTVQYEATIEDDILSLIIRANLKEGSNAQRDIIQTFNYDIRNNKEISLEEAIEQKQLDVKDVQDKIDEEIALAEQQVEDLRTLGYSIFARDADDEMYKIENTQDFFIKDGNIYIICLWK